MTENDHQPAILGRERFASLLDVLRDEGYRLIGPVIQDGAIVLHDIEGEADLPIGSTALTGPGSYRIVPRGQPRVFAFPPEPNGPKSYLFPPRRKLWAAERSGSTVRLEPAKFESQPLALIGLHACDLRAIAIQDRVFLRPPYVDPAYKAARESAFLVAINCGGAAPTCFCASVGSGPKLSDPYDIGLTEIYDEDGHRFLVTAGSEKGQRALARIETSPARDVDLEAAEQATRNAIRMQERSLRTEGLRERLYAHPEHPRWYEVAARCLACGNCTSVCPTCFCHTVEDASDLTGKTTERSRVWDSCFNVEFSYIHGGSVRSSVASRYRQWLTHKMAAWQDQFGTLGCVGCGRCITWCPAGIDIVEEANAIGGKGTETPSARAAVSLSTTEVDDVVPIISGGTPGPRNRG